MAKLKGQVSDFQEKLKEIDHLRSKEKVQFILFLQGRFSKEPKLRPGILLVKMGWYKKDAIET